MSRLHPPRAVLAPLLAFTVFFSALSHGLFPERADQDFWWHLKTGRIIVENGYRLPEKDVFSFTSAEYAWHNHEWLAQLAMYHVYLWGEAWRAGRGVQWVISAKALLIALAFFLLFLLLWRRTGNAPLAALLAVLAINCSRFTMYPRPPVITYLFIPLFWCAIHFYLTNKNKWPLFVALPLLMILWVNLHGGFILGLIMLAAFGGGDWLLAAALYCFEKTRTKADDYLRRGAIFFSACALCGLATLLNPYGWRLYGMFSRVMSEPQLLRGIPELLPPDFTHTSAFLVMLVLLGAVVFVPEFFGWFLFFRTIKTDHGGQIDTRYFQRMKFHPGEILLAVFITHQALNHVRHLPIFALLTAPLLAAIYQSLFEARGDAAMDNMDELDGADEKSAADEKASKDGASRAGDAAAVAPAVQPAAPPAAAAAPPDKLQSSRKTPSAQVWRAPHYTCAALALGFAFYYFYFQDRITDPEYIRENQPGRAEIRYMTYIERNKRLLRGIYAEPFKYPVELCDFILAHPFHGRMYNTINDAGYLIWRLSPRPHRTFTDDRFDIFGNRFRPDAEIIRTAQAPLAVAGGTQPGWRELLDSWRINFIVIGQGEPLAGKLLAENGKNWTLVYSPSAKIPPGRGHLIFVRNVAENRELITACLKSMRQRQLSNN